MKQTWHIAKKDLRRVAVPVAALSGFVLVAAIWFSRAHLAPAAVVARDELSWINGIRLVATWTMGMQFVMSLLLAGYLVLEDPVLGTTNFWQTRPIGHGRLLAAKTTAAVIGLVLAPTVVLCPVWLASGLGVGELARAAAGFAAVQVILVVIAFLFASLTRTIAEYFFSTLAAMVVGALALAKPRAFGWGTELGVNVEATRWWLVLALALAIAVSLIVVQFLTRRTRLGWCLLVAGLIAVHLVRVFWPRDLSGWFRVESSRLAAVDESGQAVEVGSLSLDARGQANLVLRTDSGKDGRMFAPQFGDVQLRWAGGRAMPLKLKPGAQWATDAVRKLEGMKRTAGRIAWNLAGAVDAGKFAPGSVGPAIMGTTTLARATRFALEEAPLQPGAGVRGGSVGFRIVAINEGSRDERPSLVVEERDIWSRRESEGAVGEGSPADSRWVGYFLINRSADLVQALPTVQQAEADLNKLLVRVRRMEFSLPEPLAGSRAGTVLVRVCMEREGQLIREVVAEKTNLVMEDANP